MRGYRFRFQAECLFMCCSPTRIKSNADTVWLVKTGVFSPSLIFNKDNDWIKDVSSLGLVTYYGIISIPKTFTKIGLWPNEFSRHQIGLLQNSKRDERSLGKDTYPLKNSARVEKSLRKCFEQWEKIVSTQQKRFLTGLTGLPGYHFYLEKTDLIFEEKFKVSWEISTWALKKLYVCFW